MRRNTVCVPRSRDKRGADASYRAAVSGAPSILRVLAMALLVGLAGACTSLLIAGVVHVLWPAAVLPL